MMARQQGRHRLQRSQSQRSKQLLVVYRPARGAFVSNGSFPELARCGALFRAARTRPNLNL